MGRTMRAFAAVAAGALLAAGVAAAPAAATVTAADATFADDCDGTTVTVVNGSHPAGKYKWKLDGETVEEIPQNKSATGEFYVDAGDDPFVVTVSGRIGAGPWNTLATFTHTWVQPDDCITPTPTPTPTATADPVNAGFTAIGDCQDGTEFTFTGDGVLWLVLDGNGETVFDGPAETLTLAPDVPGPYTVSYWTGDDWASDDIWPVTVAAPDLDDCDTDPTPTPTVPVDDDADTTPVGNTLPLTSGSPAGYAALAAVALLLAGALAFLLTRRRRVSFTAE